MILTEEMIKNLPLITEEELREISVPTEELIENAINEFNRRADETFMIEIRIPNSISQIVIQLTIKNN